MDQKIWMISGASRGIGRAIALEALEAGDCCVVTARKTESVADLEKKYEGRCKAVRLDVDDQAQIEAAVKTATDAFGRIDILINNAGYGLQGTVEEVSMDQVRAQMETNVFGLISLTQEVLPLMREQGSGYIVNVASIAGLRGMAALGIYNASKFAVVGLSEALASELTPLGIKVSCVEPGPYRTDWAGSSLKRSQAMKDSVDGPYAELNAKAKQRFDDGSGNQPGDPVQIAKVLVEASKAENPPLHMVFGDVAISVWEKKMEQYRDSSFMTYYPHDKYNL